MALSLTTERAPLLAALGTILKTVERTHVIPVLSHLLITATGEHVTVAGTDLDIQVEAVLPATVEAAGSATVPAQAFRDLVKKAPEREALRIADDADRRLMTISAGKARATVPGLNVAEFPDLRALASEGFTHQFTLPGSKLAALLDRCDFAISTEETRIYLNGIYVHVLASYGPPMLRLVATDGSRLAQISAPMPDDLDPSMPGIIIPRKTVALIRDLAASARDEDVRISCSSKAVSIASGALVITSKLVDGTFPDYQRVIPAHGAQRARVPAKAVCRILDFCTTLSLEAQRSVRLSFEDGQLAVSLSNNDGGEVRDEVEIEFDGQPYHARVNARFLSEILESSGADTVLMELGDHASSPIRIGNQPDEALFVLMPMRG